MPTVITGTDGINQVQAGAVESGDLPAGSVIQVKQTYIASTGHISTTSTSLVGSGITVSITPTKIGNKIIVQLFNPMVNTNAAANMSGKMFVNGSAIANADEYHLGYQNTGSQYSTWAFSGDLVANSLSTLTFEPFFLSGDGSDARFSHNFSSVALIAMEIAG